MTLRFFSFTAISILNFPSLPQSIPTPHNQWVESTALVKSSMVDAKHDWGSIVQLDLQRGKSNRLDCTKSTSTNNLHKPCQTFQIKCIGRTGSLALLSFLLGCNPPWSLCCFCSFIILLTFSKRKIICVNHRNDNRDREVIFISQFDGLHLCQCGKVRHYAQHIPVFSLYSTHLLLLLLFIIGYSRHIYQ